VGAGRHGNGAGQRQIFLFPNPYSSGRHDRYRHGTVHDLKRERKLTIVEVILLGDLLVEINAAWFSNSKDCWVLKE
jgi:hypothetical protein